MKKLEIFKIARHTAGKAAMPSDAGLFTSMIVRLMINIQVTDLIANIQKRIELFSIKSADNVRECPEKIACFSPDIQSATNELKKYLDKKLYKHYKVTRMSIKAQKVIRELYMLYTEFPSALPDDYFSRIETDGLMLTVCDYIAGMTDRFALEEHQKLTDPMIRV